ncbi:CAMK/CAMK-unique protein kinase [Mycena sanguinolenta]|uniref:CAMK/CAMK-unique protein kinase n=1 Tax=Mycena sanguinolenta TaxID=230812 RepID=A0A8H6YFL1_9AGAR|nr:CAMK/CAMK-unique protein kinase [Mycena sanguinolenta]
MPSPATSASATPAAKLTAFSSSRIYPMCGRVRITSFADAERHGLRLDSELPSSLAFGCTRIQGTPTRFTDTSLPTAASMIVEPPCKMKTWGPAVRVLSASPIEDPGPLPSSPAALFLSSFLQSPPANAPEPDGEGQVVGGFTLGPIFAHGGFSTIRRATTSNGAVVAVKCVPKQRERGAARRIAHEEAIWTSLSHEHILPLFACIHSATIDFFVTQLCPAGSLFDIMRAGVPPREDAGRMFRQIVRGLRYLHTEKRLVHRDVKLENVLVDEAGVCRISDFGMARYIDEPAEASEEEQPERAGLSIPIPSGPGGVHRAVSLAVPRTSPNPFAQRDRSKTTTTTEEFQPGSLPYAAPELLGPPPLTSSTSMTGKTKAAALASKSSSAFVSHSKSAPPATTIAHNSNPAPAQDIWALGVLLYALLMGRLPFVDSFEPRLVLKILGGTYTLPTDVNRRTLAVLHGCLTARVSDRWPIERVDEAAWGIGDADTHVPSDSSGSDDADEEVHGRAHAAKHALPERENAHALDRGRPGAAARRAERSSSRAPYTTSRTNSHSQSLVRSKSRAAREESRSHTDSHSHSRSRTRKSEPEPQSEPKPTHPPPPSLLGLGFNALGIGLGFPSGKGPGNGERAGRKPRTAASTGEEADPEADAEAADGMGPSLLFAPENLNGDRGEGRRAGSTPPVAWRGGAGCLREWGGQFAIGPTRQQVKVKARSMLRYNPLLYSLPLSARLSVRYSLSWLPDLDFCLFATSLRSLYLSATYSSIHHHVLGYTVSLLLPLLLLHRLPCCLRVPTHDIPPPSFDPL